MKDRDQGNEKFPITPIQQVICGKRLSAIISVKGQVWMCGNYKKQELTTQKDLGQFLQVQEPIDERNGKKQKKTSSRKNSGSKMMEEHEEVKTSSGKNRKGKQ